MSFQIILLESKNSYKISYPVNAGGFLLTHNNYMTFTNRVDMAVKISIRVTFISLTAKEYPQLCIIRSISICCRNGVRLEYLPNGVPCPLVLR